MKNDATNVCLSVWVGSPIDVYKLSFDKKHVFNEQIIHYDTKAQSWGGLRFEMES